MIDIDDTERNGLDPRCSWFWCWRVWRVDIDEDARNYEDEVLWLVLWKFDANECVDICYEG